jgi:hypothetical protein
VVPRFETRVDHDMISTPTNDGDFSHTEPVFFVTNEDPISIAQRHQRKDEDVAHASPFDLCGHEEPRRKRHPLRGKFRGKALRFVRHGFEQIGIVDARDDMKHPRLFIDGGFGSNESGLPGEFATTEPSRQAYQRALFSLFRLRSPIQPDEFRIEKCEFVRLDRKPYFGVIDSKNPSKLDTG